MPVTFLGKEEDIEYKKLFSPQSVHHLLERQICITEKVMILYSLINATTIMDKSNWSFPTEWSVKSDEESWIWFEHHGEEGFELVENKSGVTS